MTPGRGGAAPISASWAAGLGVSAAGPAMDEAAELAEEEGVADWHPEPGFAPGTAPERPAGIPAAGADTGLEPGAADEGPPFGALTPVPSRPAAGVPASTLELACTRASRSGATDTVRTAESASERPASAGTSR